MKQITSIAELEDALSAMGASVHVYFGASASPLRRGQWFANGTTRGGTIPQVLGHTLEEALNALLGRTESVDVIVTRADLKAAEEAAEAAASTSLSDLLS